MTVVTNIWFDEGGGGGGGGGVGVYSDLEMISSLLHLNQLWGGGARLPCSLISIRQWLMNSDQLVINYTSNNSHIPCLMLVIVWHIIMIILHVCCTSFFAREVNVFFKTFDFQISVLWLSHTLYLLLW